MIRQRGETLRMSKLRFDLLYCLGAKVPRPVLEELTKEELKQFCQHAAQHLLEPLLYWHSNEGGQLAALPEPVQERWSRTFGLAGIEALVKRELLHRIAKILEKAGIGFVVLKGAALAWSLYPDPALRPMRDLDLLISPEHVKRAYGLLLANGCERYPGDAEEIDFAFTHYKHLPALRDKRTGNAIELHSRLLDPRLSRSEKKSQLLDTNALIARSLAPQLDVEARCLPPEELLLHLVIHSAYDSRFSNGPLVLADINFLLSQRSVDWPRFWDLAEEGGWVSGCCLILKLVEEFQGTQSVAWPDDVSRMPSRDVIEAAALNMLLDKDHWSEFSTQLEIRSNSSEHELGGQWRRLFPRKAQLQNYLGTLSTGAWVWLAYPAWLISRLFRRVQATHDLEFQLELDRGLRITNWLAGK